MSTGPHDCVRGDEGVFRGDEGVSRSALAQARRVEIGLGAFIRSAVAPEKVSTALRNLP